MWVSGDPEDVVGTREKAARLKTAFLGAVGRNLIVLLSQTVLLKMCYIKFA